MMSRKALRLDGVRMEPGRSSTVKPKAAGLGRRGAAFFAS